METLHRYEWQFMFSLRKNLLNFFYLGDTVGRHNSLISVWVLSDNFQSYQ